MILSIFMLRIEVKEMDRFNREITQRRIDKNTVEIKETIRKNGSIISKNTTRIRAK